ncbi:MAG: TRAP transporter permease [Eubacteriales bacterium]|nr:TRAP transporter permease [Eubacteriales bacterium]
MQKNKNKINDTEPRLNTEGMTDEAIAQLEAEAVLRKYDKESAYRDELPANLTSVIGFALACFSVFQLYTTIFTIPSHMLRIFHLTFVLVFIFLLYPAYKNQRRDFIPWYDWCLVGLTLCVMLYIPIRYDYVISNIGNYTMLETVVGVLGMLLVMEACRRCVGMPIIVIVNLFLLYTLFGNYVPGTFGHRGYSIARVASHMFFTTEGIFGTPIGVSSTFIFLFILFGAFLDKTGVGKLFIDISNAIAGKYSGGPAKVAVIASALEGTVSGSSVANTVGSGSFTIPAMIRLGYKREFAGAVEAAASTGGQIMPPIMGAAAFLMAEMTGYRYSEIVLAAIIPAILYFTGILISVHHEAKKSKLVGMSPDEIPNSFTIIKERGHLFLPMIFIIYILSNGMTPSYAALGAILTALMAYSLQYWSLIPSLVIVVGFQLNIKIQICALAAISVWFVMCVIRLLVKRNYKNISVNEPGRLKSILAHTNAVSQAAFGFEPSEIYQSLISGARGVLAVAVACAMAGMIVGSVTLTGVGMKFATGLANLSGGNLYLMLFFTMLASLILGMGVPTTANYLITSTICAPAIISMLVNLGGFDGPTKAITISAHLFVFYFGIVADITPPVALAAMAGAAIAKANPFKTAITATRLAIAAFIVPYIFVLNPQMLMIDTNFAEVIIIVITSVIGMYGVSGGLAGFVLCKNKWYESLILIGGGLGLIVPGLVSDSIGFVLILSVMILQKLRKDKQTVKPAA